MKTSVRGSEIFIGLPCKGTPNALVKISLFDQSAEEHRFLIVGAKLLLLVKMPQNLDGIRNLVSTQQCGGKSKGVRHLEGNGIHASEDPHFIIKPGMQPIESGELADSVGIVCETHDLLERFQMRFQVFRTGKRGGDLPPSVSVVRPQLEVGAKRDHRLFVISKPLVEREILHQKAGIPQP